MKKTMWLALVCFVLASGVRAASDDEIFVGPLQLAVIPPVQILEEYASVQGLRLNLLCGRNRNVSWLDIGPVNETTEDFRGLGIGLVNSVGGTGRGAMLGILNRTGDDLMGFQAGIGNLVGESVGGFQIGLINTAHSMTGYQIGILNTAWFATGFQLGVMNVSGHMDGVQVGLLNVITEKYRWCALPLVNASW